jgi:hypothetical protein
LSETLRFFPLLRCHRLRPYSLEEPAFLWCDLGFFCRLVHLHRRGRRRLVPG